MTIIPNAFQTPNLYVDRVMPYLTESELRVLIFATRHILGWQDTIKKRQNTISITMFERGFTTKDGDYYAGCGLGRAAIIKALEALVEFGLLGKDGEATNDGQKWTLKTTGINWEQLEARQGKQLDAFRTRTRKAREKAAMKRDGGLSDTPDEPGLSDTPEVVSPTHQDWFVAQTESKPSSKPSSKPEDKDIAPDGAAVDASPFVRTIQPDAPIFNKDRVFDVLAFVCWGIRDMRDVSKPILVKGKEKDNPAGAMIGKIKNWLMQLYPEKDEAFVAERVRTFYYDTPEAKRQYIPKDLAKFITAWLKWYQKDLPAPKLKEAAAGYTDELLPGAELE